MKTELQYRTFQQLVESATLDIPHLSLEGAFDPQQLLKVVTKINYELGLRISPQRSKLLELRHGRAKLPDDFHVANYAVLCSDRHTVSIETGRNWQLGRTPARQFITVVDPVAVVGSSSESVLREFSITLDLVPGDNLVAHNLDAEHVLVQAFVGTGRELIESQYGFPTANGLVIRSLAAETVPNVLVRVLAARLPDPTTEFFTTTDLTSGDTTLTHPFVSNQYLLQVLSPTGEVVDCGVSAPATGTLVLHSDDVATLVGARVLLLSTRVASLIPPRPCPQLCEVVDTERELLVRYQRTYGQREEYRRVTPLHFVRSKGVSAECHGLVPRTYDQVSLQNGFLVGPVPDGHILLCYTSVLEDEQGQLLTLDHPKVNDYYEYAIKDRVYENLWLAGEDVQQKLQYLQDRKLRPARFEALSFVNTPDFADFKRIWELNRKAAHHKYYALFL